MKKFSTSPIKSVFCGLNNKNLLFTLVRQDIISRYKGSIFGLLWAFITPLLMLAVYTFVFGEIFKARWGGDNSTTMQFSLMLFIGLIVFNFFSEVVNKSPSLIIANANYVKKVVFPLEILPQVSMFSAAFNAMISLLIWILVYVISYKNIPMTIIFLPIVVMPLMLFTLGASWLLSALGVFVRDIGQIVGLITTAMMFLSPIFYPITSLPSDYQYFAYINPLTLPIEELRKILFMEQFPSWNSLIVYFVISLIVLWSGFYFFQKTRKGFSDVL